MPSETHGTILFVQKKFKFARLCNLSLQHFTYDYNLASYSTYVPCVNFLYEWRDVQFIADSEQQILDKLFKAILFSLCYSFFFVMSEMGFGTCLYM